MIIDKIKKNPGKFALCLASGMLAGIFIGKLVKDRVEDEWEIWDDYDYRSMEGHEDELTSFEDEETVEEKPYLNSESVPEKPSIFSLETVEEDTVDVNTPRHISIETYQAIDEEHAHAATYFVEDDILAGVDNKLDELDPEDIFGGIPDDALTELRNGSVSGMYVLCGNGIDAMEIMTSHDNYLEAYNETVELEVDKIMAESGYSETRPNGRPKSSDL